MHIYYVCRPVEIFGGVYAKDTYIQALRQAKYMWITPIPRGPQASSGLLWITHRTPVSFSTLTALTAPCLPQSFGKEPLVWRIVAEQDGREHP